MTLAGILLTIVAVVAAAGLALWMMRREMRGFLALAEQRLLTDRAEHVGDLESRKKDVERMVQGLEQQLGRYEQLVRAFEQDRDRKYGSLERQITSAVAETQKLGQTTAQLTAMLGNARVRGQWGEKAADDILKLCGLQDGVHFIKQRNAPVGRPDFTFLLPNEHRCYMDVKFPLDNYVRLINSEREDEQKLCREQFMRDVRGHMKTLEKRDYASSAGADPDYVLMFIPNEQVYGALNEWMPGLIDEGMAKRIILCGPWTLYAQVRLIWQAWQNYYYAQTIGEIAKTVTLFLQDYEKFKERFKELGQKLAGASEKYDELARVSFARLDQKIERIKEYRQGQLQAPGVLDAESESSPAKEVVTHG